MTITAVDVARKAVELAEANPEFVYKSEGDRCLYVHRDDEGKPNGEGCLFGQALVGLGVDPERLKPCEGLEISVVLSNLGVDRDLDLVDAMDSTQSDQDCSTAWGEAIGHTKDALAELESVG